MITWQKNLDYLYDLYQQEKKEYENFLQKEGYILGTYIQNIESVVKKYQKSRGIPSHDNIRLFGNLYTDFLLKEIIEKHSNEIIKDNKLRNQTITLLKIMKTYPEICNFFLLKVKEYEISENINSNGKMIA